MEEMLVAFRYDNTRWIWET